MSYSIDEVEIGGRVAELVNRILRGTTAAELRVEQPTKWTVAASC